ARESLAADENLKILESLSAVRCERMPECWSALKDRSASRLDRARTRRRILDGLTLGDNDTGPTDEGKKQLESRNIESDGRDRHEPIISVKRHLFSHGQEYVRQAAMLDRDAFGCSGGAGGIDDVGEVVRLKRDGRRVRGLRRNRLRRGIEIDDPRAVAGEPVAQRRGGDQQRRAGVLQHERQTLARGARGERAIS